MDRRLTGTAAIAGARRHWSPRSLSLLGHRPPSRPADDRRRSAKRDGQPYRRACRPPRRDRIYAAAEAAGRPIVLHRPRPWRPRSRRDRRFGRNHRKGADAGARPRTSRRAGRARPGPRRLDPRGRPLSDARQRAASRGGSAPACSCRCTWTARPIRWRAARASIRCPMSLRTRRRRALPRPRIGGRRTVERSATDRSAAMLSDLALREQMEASAELASRLVASPPAASSCGPTASVRRLPCPSRAETPAVLFEAGYISNADDEALLRIRSIAQAIVLALAQAIEADVAARVAALTELSARRLKPLDAGSNAVRPKSLRNFPTSSPSTSASTTASTRGGERRWVRRLTGRRCGCSCCSPASGSISRPACRAPKSCWPTSRRLPTNVRGYDGNPVQTFARERRVELAYDEYPPIVVQAFISAEDKTFFTPWRHRLSWPDRRGVRLYDARTVDGGRAPRAARRSPSRSRNICSRTTNYTVSRKIREAILAFRLEIDAEQAADPRTLSQFDLPWPQRLWRAGGEPRLFRQGRHRTDAAGSGLSCGPAQGPGQLRSGARDPARPRPPQLRAPGDGQQRLHHRGAGAPPPRRRSAPSATAATRNSTSRAAISWRKFAAS